MDIKIFEDQTGLMLFPEKGLDKTSFKNMDIVKLFDNKIDLHITHREDFLELTCYLLVHRGQERAIGCYIVGKGKYTDTSFGDFKSDANWALRNIGFEHHYDNAETLVFDNIEKFDMDGQSHKDIDLIVEAKNSGDRVNYKGGDIGEIASLCRQILRRVRNIDIVISTVENNIGHVNIVISRTHDERLYPTSQGRLTLDRQIRRAEYRRLEEQNEIRKKEEEKIKQKEREIVDEKIEQGTALIKKGLDIKRKAGYGDIEINSNVRILNSVINGELSHFPREIEKNENENLDEDGRRKKEEKENLGEIGNDKIKEGAFLVRDAIISKRKDGYNDIEINSDLRIRNSGIIVKNYVSPNENEKYYKRGEYDDDIKHDTFYRLAAIVLIVVIVIIILVLTSLLFYRSQCEPISSGRACYYANVAVNMIPYHH
jgi:hypothetical protein